MTTTSIARYDSLDTMLATEPTYQLEVDKIVQFYAASNMMREIALYRLYRMYINREWDSEFKNGTDFINQLCTQMGVSPRTVYERMKTYDIFAWLGVHEQNAIRKLLDNSTLYSQVFQHVVKDWDLDLHLPRTIQIPGLTEFDTQEAKDAVNKLVADSESYDKQYEAIDHIKADILGVPLIKIYMKQGDDAIYIDYETYVVDGITGKKEIDSHGYVSWLPQDSIPIPDEVVTALRKRIEKK